MEDSALAVKISLVETRISAVNLTMLVISFISSVGPQTNNYRSAVPVQWHRYSQNISLL